MFLRRHKFVQNKWGIEGWYRYFLNSWYDIGAYFWWGIWRKTQTVTSARVRWYSDLAMDFRKGYSFGTGDNGLIVNLLAWSCEDSPNSYWNELHAVVWWNLYEYEVLAYVCICAYNSPTWPIMTKSDVVMFFDSRRTCKVLKSIKSSMWEGSRRKKGTVQNNPI